MDAFSVTSRSGITIRQRRRTSEEGDIISLLFFPFFFFLRCHAASEGFHFVVFHLLCFALFCFLFLSIITTRKSWKLSLGQLSILTQRLFPRSDWTWSSFGDYLICITKNENIGQTNRQDPLFTTLLRSGCLLFTLLMIWKIIIC